MGTWFLEVSNGGAPKLECITCAGVYQLTTIQILWYEWRYWKNYAWPTMTSQNDHKKQYTYDNNIPASFILELVKLYYNQLCGGYKDTQHSGIWMLDMWRIQNSYVSCVCLYKYFWVFKTTKGIQTQDAKKSCYIHTTIYDSLGIANLLEIL